MFNLFKKKPSLPPEVEALFARIKKLIEDEQFQNDFLPEQLKKLVLNGTSVDIFPGRGIHDFGRTLENPIPVNGSLGELVYLSSLRRDNDYVLFHRLGHIGKVDVYETVTMNKGEWDILYLDMYHPRKSNFSPSFYKKTPLVAFFTGTNSYLPDFPKMIPDEISEVTRKVFGVPLPRTEIRVTVGKNSYSRPKEQIALINHLIGNGLERGLN